MASGAAFNAVCQILDLLKLNLIIIEKSDTMTSAHLLIFLGVFIYLVTILYKANNDTA